MPSRYDSSPDLSCCSTLMSKVKRVGIILAMTIRFMRVNRTLVIQFGYVHTGIGGLILQADFVNSGYIQGSLGMADSLRSGTYTWNGDKYASGLQRGKLRASRQIGL